MNERCHNKKHHSYPRYGGRGITVCEAWKTDFQAFCKWARENGYDPDTERGECTIDRIDNDAGYSPDNCRWVSMKEQANNRSTNRNVEFAGQNLSISEWADLLGIRKETLRKRLDSGWSIEESLTKPITRCKSSLYR